MTQGRFVSNSIRIFLSRMTLALAIASPLLLQGDQSIAGKRSKDHRIAAKPGVGSEQRLEFNLDRYSVDVMEEDGKLYSRLNCQGGVLSERKGYAELPFFHAAFQLARAEKCRVVIEEEAHEDLVLDHPMLPSKGVIYRNEDPSQIKRFIAPESIKNGWYPKKDVEVTEPFIFRDARGINVYLYPFRYHAATQTLRVVTRMVVRVEPIGDILDEDFTTQGKRVAEMEAVYKSLFVNSNDPNLQYWSHEVGEKGAILVIHTPRDASAIQPYVQWKREKGFKVKVIQVATGTNVKSLIKQEYLADPSLLYVQLVGDWDDIKSDLGTRQNKPMDPALGCVAGNDNYPELIIGRFSANSAAQVTTQVNKAINYEKNTNPASDWFKRGLVIASSEGTGDDGESDIDHEKNIRDHRLLRTSFTSVTSALGDSTAKSVVTNAVNQGLSVINYTGHGGVTGWGTTGFNNSDASALTNGSKLPVICSVACVVGSFQSDCFAEAWLRNPNGGAVAGLFSSINQPWSPPMRGQDYFNDMLTGGYNYASLPGDGISTTSGRNTLGSIALNALVLMYSESSGIDDLETIQSWTLFGDAALEFRPTPVINNVTVSISPTATTINTNTQKQFTASVTGSANTAVTWTCTGGSVNSSGLYIAPATAGTYTVKAISQANSSKYAIATVTVTTSQGPIGYTRCASEGGSFSLPGLSDVAYGANGKFAYKYAVTGNILFNNATFGDPIPGVIKAGYYKLCTTPPGYTRCANEGQSFTLPGLCDVAYGADGKFAYKYGVAGPITFNNTTFGDPNPGTPKYGFYKICAVSNAYYFLRARHSSKVLDVSGVSSADGANIHQWSFLGADNQKWQLQDAGNGYFFLKAKHSGKYLDVSGVSSSDGANVHQWSFTGANNQKWQLQDAGNGYYFLRAVHSGKYLDVSGVSTADGANIYQWYFTGAYNQQWKLEKTN